LEAQDQERHSTYGKLSTLLNQQKQKNKEFTWDDAIPNIWKNKHHVPNHQPDEFTKWEKSSGNMR
jgi:hypothetical protein